MQTELCWFPARPPGSASPVVTALPHQSAWATICTDHIKPVFPVYMVRRVPRVTGHPYPNIASSNALIWLHLCHLPKAWTLCTLPSGASEAQHPWNPYILKFFSNFSSFSYSHWNLSPDDTPSPALPDHSYSLLPKLPGSFLSIPHRFSVSKLRLWCVFV